MTLWQSFCFSMHLLWQILYPLKNERCFCWKDDWDKESAQACIYIWQEDGQLLYEIPLSTAKPKLHFGKFQLHPAQVQTLLLDSKSLQELAKAIKEELNSQGLDHFSISIQSSVSRNSAAPTELSQLHNML